MAADLITVCAALGALVFLKHALVLLQGLYARLLRPGKDIKRSYGEWAVVTGATDGIGKAMAFEFARKGCSVLLISRSADKLQECQKELQAKHSSVQVAVLAIDYKNFDAAARERVAATISGKDVGVLVNNVGVSYPFTKYFHELDDSNVEDLITLNVNSTTWMTRIVLPGMIDRKRGAIVNIASAAGVTTSPLLSQYGAAKSYVAMFSKAMNAELKSKGIHVQCQIPLFVATKLAKIRKASLTVASPGGYARAAVAAIGFETIVSPFWSHALQMWALQSLPEWIGTAITMSIHQDIRRKGMKKEAAEKEGASLTDTKKGKTKAS